MRIMSGLVIVGVVAGTGAWAQDTPSPALLVLHKGENAMAIVDPESGKIAGHVPVGQDPHELAVSAGGKLAFASN
jgi:DNA-binding beta-propeller fold protein YncE